MEIYIEDFIDRERWIDEYCNFKGSERRALEITNVMQSLVPQDFKRLKVNLFRGRRKKLDFA